MDEIFSIDGHRCCCTATVETGSAVFLLGLSDLSELEEIRQRLRTLAPDTSLILAAYEVADWNRDLSPWEAPTANEGRFPGNGSDTLNWLLGHLVPWLQTTFPGQPLYHVGYSLARLFALWSLYETKVFSGAASCSGSLWLEGWDAFAETHPLQSPAAVYLSLGGKEERSKLPMLATIGDRTRAQEKRLKQDVNVTRCALEWNPGGHFADPSGRLAKGILWLQKARRNP